MNLKDYKHLMGDNIKVSYYNFKTPDSNILRIDDWVSSGYINEILFSEGYILVMHEDEYSTIGGFVPAVEELEEMYKMGQKYYSSIKEYIISNNIDVSNSDVLMALILGQNE